MQAKVIREVEVSICDFCGSEVVLGHLSRCALCGGEGCGKGGYAEHFSFSFGTDGYRYGDGARISHARSHICIECAAKIAAGAVDAGKLLEGLFDGTFPLKERG